MQRMPAYSKPPSGAAAAKDTLPGGVGTLWYITCEFMANDKDLTSAG